MFFKILAITKAEFGKPVIVKCDIRFHLPIAITWLRFNDKTREKEIIKPSNKYSISSDETKLTINNADLYSMGKYSCNASLVSDKDQNIGFDTDVIIEGLCEYFLSFRSFFSNSYTDKIACHGISYYTNAFLIVSVFYKCICLLLYYI